MIRDARMKQLQQQAADATSLQGKRATIQRGALHILPADTVFSHICSQELLVTTICQKSNGACPARTAHRELPEDSVCRLMAGLAAQHPHTLFARVDIAPQRRTRRGDELLASLRLDALPAVVCFREGAIVRRAVGEGGLRQFVGLGDLGATVFRAWLAAADVLRAPGGQPAPAPPRARGGGGSSSEEEADGDGGRPRAKLLVSARCAGPGPGRIHPCPLAGTRAAIRRARPPLPVPFRPCAQPALTARRDLGGGAARSGAGAGARRGSCAGTGRARSSAASRTSTSRPPPPRPRPPTPTTPAAGPTTDPTAQRRGARPPPAAGGGGGGGREPRARKRHVRQCPPPTSTRLPSRGGPTTAGPRPGWPPALRVPQRPSESSPAAAGLSEPPPVAAPSPPARRRGAALRVRGRHRPCRGARRRLFDQCLFDPMVKLCAEAEAWVAGSEAGT